MDDWRFTTTARADRGSRDVDDGLPSPLRLPYFTGSDSPGGAGGRVGLHATTPSVIVTMDYSSVH